jgi:hypothetical protein
MLAKGKTQRCEWKFGTNPNIIVHHAEIGWASEEFIAHILSG